MPDAEYATPEESARRCRRLIVPGLAAVGWLACFAMLRYQGTWLPFAATGLLLAFLALWTDATTRALLRPTWGRVGVGLAAGVVMAGLTHVAYSLLVEMAPALRPQTQRLYALLNVGGFSPLTRAGLVVLVGSAEEVVFRGSILSGLPPHRRSLFFTIGPPGLVRILALALVYALTMSPLGSHLLVLVGFGCALVWGVLRVATRSLVVPILTHIVWDLALLVLWPLVPH